MTIGTGKLKEAFINPDLAYALWLTTGSITRATRRFADEGIRNPLTGNPACRMGVWSAAAHSEHYKTYVEKRKSGELLSDKPTDEEFAKARSIINDMLAPEKARNHQDLIAYGKIRE
jgi:hypothetical protein